MPFCPRGTDSACLAIAIACCLLSAAAPAQTVWSGLTYSFTKADGADPQLAQNQDRISDSVWISRNDTEGLFNVLVECDAIDGCFYTHNSSPADTRWATGLMVANTGKTIAATNWMELAFTDWEAAYQNHVGAEIEGANAVLHLIPEDIYLDLQFTDWAVGRDGGQGGFSYLRAEPPGDYNDDLEVNAADYTVWRNTLGQAAAPYGSGADGDADGTVDEGDYDFWKAHFGNPVPGAGGGPATAVPEPATIFLLLSGLLTIVRRQRFSSRGPGQIFLNPVSVEVQ